MYPSYSRTHPHWTVLSNYQTRQVPRRAPVTGVETYICIMDMTVLDMKYYIHNEIYTFISIHSLRGAFIILNVLYYIVFIYMHLSESKSWYPKIIHYQAPNVFVRVYGGSPETPISFEWSV